MALTYYLAIDGLPNPDAGPIGAEGAFQVLSYRWGLEQPTTTPPGPGGAGQRPVFSDFIVTKPVGAGSPTLFLWSARAQSIPRVALMVFDTRDGRLVEVERYTLQEVVFNVVSNSGTQGASQETAELHMRYGIITHMVTLYDAAGRRSTEQRTWNVRTNTGS